jgi:hypothetical protein
MATVKAVKTMDLCSTPIKALDNAKIDTARDENGRSRMIRHGRELNLDLSGSKKFAVLHLAFRLGENWNKTI